MQEERIRYPNTGDRFYDWAGLPSTVFTLSTVTQVIASNEFARRALTVQNTGSQTALVGSKNSENIQILANGVLELEDFAGELWGKTSTSTTTVTVVGAFQTSTSTTTSSSTSTSTTA